MRSGTIREIDNRNLDDVTDALESRVIALRATVETLRAEIVTLKQRIAELEKPCDSHLGSVEQS